MSRIISAAELPNVVQGPLSVHPQNGQSRTDLSCLGLAVTKNSSFSSYPGVDNAREHCRSNVNHTLITDPPSPGTFARAARERES